MDIFPKTNEIIETNQKNYSYTIITKFTMDSTQQFRNAEVKNQKLKVKKLIQSALQLFCIIVPFPWFY
ncbi:MAG: hypothetical protein AN482_10140 [Anabaena sp. LE011-02]|jgi:hypothetical protein|nr:MAG: hypothetical protein AN482_10140 [Anabaena sp. LE011-02]